MSPEKKKTTTKSRATKTTKKKVASKSTTAKKTAAPKKAEVVQTVETSASSGMNWLPWILVMALLGVLFGVFFADMHTKNKFGTGKDMVVVGEQTWMPVPGKPVDVMVLNDENCGQGCDTTAALDALRQNITPALMISEISINSDEGQRLVSELDLVSVPQYFFGQNIEEMEAEDGTRFIDNMPEGILVQNDDMYWINGSAVGFPTGKFIKAPEFANLDTEPKKGTGPVQVVEFTDYQCPFCKRLFDNNRELIDELIADDKITYVVKDFPLGFHAEAPLAHQAANCALKESGQEAYWDMHDEIFNQTDSWSGKGAAAREVLISIASGIGTDIEACMSEGGIQGEINDDMQEGSRYGVTGTPALFIGTQFMPGAIGPDQFRAAVEAELAN